MGYYINSTSKGLGLPATGKAEMLVLDGAELISTPSSFQDIEENKALICIVDNFTFEAAGLCYNESEFEEFVRDDGRPRTWLTMEKDVAHKLADYDQ